MANIRRATIAGNASDMLKVMQRRFSSGIFEAPILGRILNDSQAYGLDNPAGFNLNEDMAENNLHYTKDIEISVINIQQLKYDEERDFPKDPAPIITGGESAWIAMGQIIIPFLIAGMGNVAAGIVLDTVQHWDAFEAIPQLIILVPALLGLKGNVEMTLASRLSTHANLGHMDDSDDLRSMIVSNMALVQCQASTVGLIAPLVAVAFSILSGEDHEIKFEAILIVTASSVITANIANLVLGSLMCSVVVLSRKFNINPDNIATPIAASLGDFTTMLLLAFISHILYVSYSTVPWLPTLLLISLLILIPLWIIIARRNFYTSPVLINGWIPILGAMMLQNAGGLIMENALAQFHQIAAFQPIINGVGGNLVAIQSSRISTYLNRVSEPKKLPKSDSKFCVFPFTTFFGQSPHALMVCLLLLLAGPSHILFLFILRIFKDQFIFTFSFLAFYILAALIQVALLLYLCYCMVHLMWKLGIDPDNSSIPFLTALADLLGAGLLALAFFILLSMQDPNTFKHFPAVNLTITKSQTNSTPDFVSTIVLANIL